MICRKYVLDDVYYQYNIYDSKVYIFKKSKQSFDFIVVDRDIFTELLIDLDDAS